MSTQTVKGALAKREGQAMNQITVYRQDFATMLPSHIRAATWLRSAQGLLRKNPKLARVCDKNTPSFLAALLDCARWGLDPGITYHFIPFGDEVVGVRDYKGIVELMYRAGAVSTVHVEVVYEHDVFDYDRTSKAPPTHTPPLGPNGRPNWAASQEARGKMILAYAYAEMKDGGISQVVIMPEWEIDEHRRESKTAHLADSLWQKWPRAAWKKTVARELEKWVPSSPEWITHKVAAERADGAEPLRQLSAAALALPAPVIDDEGVLDGEVVVEQPAPPTAPAPARSSTPDEPPAPAHPDPASDAATQKPNRAQMTRLTKLLAEAGVTSDEGRLRLIAHVSGRDDVTTLEQLTANDVSQLITKLDALKAAGRLGAHATATDTGEQPPADTTTEGE